MAHMIEIKEDGSAKMASTSAEWHFDETGHPILPALRKGMKDYDKIKAEWLDLTGLAEIMEKVPAYQAVQIPGEEEGEFETVFSEVEGQYWIRRQSDAKCFGVVTDQYKIFQPRECIEFLEEFVGVDERFALSTAGTLKGGAVVWANFTFSEDFEVMGENHRFNLLATTTFDGTGSTRMQGRSIRTVCNNTLQAGEFGAAGVTVGHRTEWTDSIRKQAKQKLADVLSSMAQYKAMGEALSLINMSKDQAEQFLSSLLFQAKEVEKEVEVNGEKVLAKVMTEPSTRTQNLIDKLMSDYEATVAEGTDKNNAWTVLNTITRFADHSMGVRKTEGKSEQLARDESRIIGTASAFKSKGVSSLLKLIEADPKAISQRAQEIIKAEPMLQAA